MIAAADTPLRLLSERSGPTVTPLRVLSGCSGDHPDKTLTYILVRILSGCSDSNPPPLITLGWGHG